MGRIYAKAQKDKLNRDLDEIRAMLCDMEGEDFQISRQKILDRLEEMMAESEKKQSEPVETKSGRDFILANDKIHQTGYATGPRCAIV